MFYHFTIYTFVRHTHSHFLFSFHSVQSFKTAQVVPRDAKKILETMVTEIESMFKSKISAVQRIMDAAENAAMTHDKEKCDEQFTFYDSKEMLEPFDPTTTVAPKKFDDRSLDPPNVTIPRIRLNRNRNFYNTPVNTSLSSVHVPTNVYGRGNVTHQLRLILINCFYYHHFHRFLLYPLRVCVCILFSACDVVKDIQWSQELDSIFISNYQKDPTLSWQFFGSSLGFMRQFPGNFNDQCYKSLNEITNICSRISSIFAFFSNKNHNRYVFVFLYVNLFAWFSV